jgi:hypothetical protein
LAEEAEASLIYFRLQNRSTHDASLKCEAALLTCLGKHEIRGREWDHHSVDLGAAINAAKVGLYAIVTTQCSPSTAQPFYTRFSIMFIIFSNCFSKVIIGFIRTRRPRTVCNASV